MGSFLLALAVGAVLLVLLQRVHKVETRLTRLEEALRGRSAPIAQAPGAPTDDQPPADQPPADQPPAEPTPPEPTPAEPTPSEPSSAAVPPPLPAARQAAAKSASPDGQVPASSRPSAPPKPAFDLERFLGGRVLLISGVVIFLFGLAFFLKYAIDRGWIGPAMRIALGSAASIAALGAGHRYGRGELRVFGSSLMGLGLGGLYLCAYFAAARYDMIPRPVAMAVIAGITAGGSVLAIRRDAAVLAYLGFLGGLIAPGLLSTGADSLEILTVWLLLLQGGVLAVTWRRAWQGLDLMNMIAATVYYAAWHHRHLTDEREFTAAVCVGALAAGLILMSALPGLVRNRRIPTTALTTVVLANLLAFVGLHALLVPEHDGLLGVIVLLIAALHAWAGFWGESRAEAPNENAPTLYGVATGGVAVAMPLLFEAQTLVVAWAAAGVVAVFIGLRRASPIVLLGGLLMVLLSMIEVVQTTLHDGAFTPYLNVGFWIWATPCIAWLAVAQVTGETTRARRVGSRIAASAGAWLLTVLVGAEIAMYFDETEALARTLARDLTIAAPGAAMAAFAVGLAELSKRAISPFRPALAVSAATTALFAALVAAIHVHQTPWLPCANWTFVCNAVVFLSVAAIGHVHGGRLRPICFGVAIGFLLLLLTGEIWSWGRTRPIDDITRGEALDAAQIWISVLWSVYATVLVGAGFARRAAALRWAGLGVFSITLCKVFVFDMAELEAVYRIASFLALGVLAIGASFLYQRLKSADDDAARTPNDDE